MKSKKSILLAAGLLPVLAVPAFADDTTMEISLRIEGIKGHVYEGTVNVPYTDQLTVLDALNYIDEQSDAFALQIVTSDYGPYITGVNDEGSALTEMGWDGWQYLVNGEAASVGVNAYNLSDKDQIVLFYSDMGYAGDGYSGMQFPVVDDSKIAEGILTFTSKDITYDASYNPTETINPVKNATVTWDSTKYTTNENGEVQIAKEELTSGSHSLAIERYNDAGSPTVLRLSEGTTISVPEQAPATGDTGIAVFAFACLLSMAGLGLVRKH